MRERTSPGGSPPDMDNPYRPYVAHAPAPQDTRRRHGAAIFHDGNAGHLWRGEVASQAGEILFTVGLILWITYLTYSPVAIAIIVAMQALPWVVVGPLAAPLQNVAEPAGGLRSAGFVRVLCALGLVALQLLHYRGILSGYEYPIVYLLVFISSLAGRLRANLRVAAAHTCLAPGDPELVANDLQIGASVVAVVGPLVATMLFLLLGGRILLVALSAAVAYFLSSSAEGLLAPLPIGRRAFTRTTLAMAVEDEGLRAELQEAAQPDEKRAGVAFGEGAAGEEARRLADRALPEWLQAGPNSPVAAITDLRSGLGLSGLANSSRTSLYILGALALIGGGLAALEVFYIVYVLKLPAFYLGPLLACEAGGLVLGSSVAGGMLARDRWRSAIGLGLFFMGSALVLLGLLPLLVVALGAALLLGAGNALAVGGARRGLRAGYDGVERRALTAAETFVSGLCGAAGAGIFVWFYLYLSPTYFSLQPVLHALSTNPVLGRFFQNTTTTIYTPWSLSELFLVNGLLLVVLSVVTGLILAAGAVGPRPQKVGVAAPMRGIGLAQGGLAGELGEDVGWAEEDIGPYGASYDYTGAYGPGETDYGAVGTYGTYGAREGYGRSSRDASGRAAYGYDDDGYPQPRYDDEDDGW